MGTIQTKYDVGDELFTVFGSNLEFAAAIIKIKVTHIGYSEHGVIYRFAGATGFYKDNGVPEHEIIGRTKEDVISAVNQYFNKEVKTLNDKRNELIHWMDTEATHDNRR